MALWKERTPSLSRSPGKTGPGSASSVSPPPTDNEGLFGIRRRAQRSMEGLRDREGVRGVRDPVTPTRRVDSDIASIRSGQLPPGFDVEELTPYTQSNEAVKHLRVLAAMR